MSSKLMQVEAENWYFHTFYQKCHDPPLIQLPLNIYETY